MADVTAIAPSLTVTDPQLATGASIASKSDFLKLLVAQLSHQDPLQPQDDSAFVAQLAQFAQLEQAQNQTTLLTQMQAQLVAQAGGQAVGLVGHEITARFDAIALDGLTTPPLQFALDSDATSATLKIQDSKGNVVRTISTGPLKGGVQSISWDGKGDGGLQLPPGAYSVTVSAAGANGAAVGARTEVKGLVTGVSFTNGRPELLVGAMRVQLGDVIQVSK